jgi:glycosyltransferase involved in cell wall biosynthesis
MWMHSTDAASRIAFDSDVPYILRPAGGLEPWRLRRGYLRSLKKKLYLECIARPAMDRAACLQATSEREAENFRRAGYRGPVSVIPGGVDIDALRPGHPSESDEYWPGLRNRPVVLFMSRLSPEKGLDLLIPLWADLVKSPSFRDAVLVVAGPDDRGYGKTVQGMLQRYALAARVHVTGMVSGPPKRALLSRADVFVLPSYSENFGIVVAEALACQTPVITTTGTPWKQLQTADVGRCVAPTRSDLAEALRELMGMSQSQRSDMGRRGRNLVEKQYTWTAVAGQFLALCEGILAGEPIPLHPKPAESPVLEGA